MQIEAAAATDIGRQRTGNEDSYVCGTTVFAVADGLGGHAGGEVASAITARALEQLDDLTFDSPEDAARALADAIRTANTSVLEQASDDTALEGMGTTVTAAAVVGEQLVLAHVGDSRAYLQRGSELQRLTADHTPVEEAVRAGEITPEEARSHPYRNMLSRAVGLEDDLDVDLPGLVRLQAGDRFLLCSDGLTGPVPDGEIGRILRGAASPEAACKALVEAALAGGGPDNVTVVTLFAS